MDAFNDLLPGLLQEYHKLYDMRNVPLSVDKLRPLIEQRGYAERIFVEAFQLDSKVVIAKVEFYRGSMGVYAGTGNYARVQYSSSLNFCWTRFAVLKEMFHCILDAESANRVTSIEELMKLGQLLVSEPFHYLNKSSFLPFETEELAEILAMETLFPMELRSHHKSGYDQGHISDYQLALRYRIPERYIRLAMMKGYYELIYNHRVDNFVVL